MLNEKALKIRLIAGLIKRHNIDILHKVSQCFPKPNERSGIYLNMQQKLI